MKLIHNHQTKECPWLTKPADNTISPEPKTHKRIHKPQTTTNQNNYTDKQTKQQYS